MVRSGKHKAREINRARVLLLSDTGKADEEIGEQLDISKTTARNIRQRYSESGIDRALYDAQRPGQPKKLNGKEEAKVVAIACTEPPEGAKSWTLDLLTERVAKEVKRIGRITIHNILLRNELKPWQEKNVVHSGD